MIMVALKILHVPWSGFILSWGRFGSHGAFDFSDRSVQCDLSRAVDLLRAGLRSPAVLYWFFLVIGCKPVKPNTSKIIGNKKKKTLIRGTCTNNRNVCARSVSDALHYVIVQVDTPCRFFSSSSQ